MQKLRSTWLALMGGAFLVTLSVSAAFGAPPTGTDGPRGQTVAAFVHELVFGADEETDTDEVANETEDETDEEGSEGDEELTEDLVVEEVELVEDGEVAGAHGECVSEEASDKTDETEADGNHGAVVSFAAQETCWDLEATDEVTDPLVEEELVEREVPAEFANHGECVSEAAQDTDSEGATEAMTHGAWVSENARYTCWSLPVPGDDTAEESSLEDEADAAELTAQEERKADQTAARAQRRTDREAAHAAKPKAANGRGGGRP